MKWNIAKYSRNHAIIYNRCVKRLKSRWTTYTRVYPKVSGLVAWRENCKWYGSLPLVAVVSPSCVSLVSFVAITRCVASRRVFIVVSVYFVIDSVRKLWDTPSYVQCGCVPNLIMAPV